MRPVNAFGEGLLFASHERIHERGSTVAFGVGDADGGFGDVSRVAHWVVA